MGRFLLTKNRLTEEVDVETVPASAQAFERRAEPLIRRVNNEVTDDLAEHASRGSSHGTRSEE